MTKTKAAKSLHELVLAGVERTKVRKTSSFYCYRGQRLGACGVSVAMMCPIFMAFPWLSPFTMCRALKPSLVSMVDLLESYAKSLDTKPWRIFV